MDKTLVKNDLRNLHLFYKQTSNADEFESP